MIIDGVYVPDDPDILEILAASQRQGQRGRTAYSDSFGFDKTVIINRSRCSDCGDSIHAGAKRCMGCRQAFLKRLAHDELAAAELGFVVLPCLVCEKPIKQPRKPGQRKRLCSDECAKRRHQTSACYLEAVIRQNAKKQLIAARKAERSVRKCLWCGQDIRRKFRESVRNYCSGKCRRLDKRQKKNAQARKDRARNNQVFIERNREQRRKKRRVRLRCCPICGDAHFRRAAKCCSVQCRQEAWRITRGDAYRKHRLERRRRAYPVPKRKSFAISHGWPDDVTPTQVQILNIMANAGVPLTRQEIASSMGTRSVGSKVFSPLLKSGMVAELPRIREGTRRYRRHGYTLGVTALSILREKADHEKQKGLDN